MYSAVIFDFFGVFCPDITLEWFQKNVPGHDQKLEHFHAICHKSDLGTLSKEDFYAELSGLAGIPAEEIVEGVQAEVIINDSLVKYVQHLKDKGIRTACLSNGTREWTLEVITSHGLGHLFDKVILSGDLGIVKPDKKIYIHALDTLDTPASRTIFVDDRIVNIQAAEACRIRSILFVDTSACIDELENLLISTV